MDKFTDKQFAVAAWHNHAYRSEANRHLHNYELGQIYFAANQMIQFLYFAIVGVAIAFGVFVFLYVSKNRFSFTLFDIAIRFSSSFFFLFIYFI